jgi:hypothetical protein
MKYSDLIVLSYREQLNHISEDGKIVPNDKDDIHTVEYISQGLEIDLNKKLYRTRFGYDHRGSYIKNGFIINDGWNKIGQGVMSDHWGNDGLLGIYNISNFKHLQSMIWDVVEANADHSNED